MPYTQLIVTQCEISSDGKVKVIMGDRKRDTTGAGAGGPKTFSQRSDFPGETQSIYRSKPDSEWEPGWGRFRRGKARDEIETVWGTLIVCYTIN